MEKITFENGTIYEGETLNGKPNGKGKKTWTDGSGKIEEGNWENGIFVGE